MNFRKILKHSGVLLATVALVGLAGCESKPTETPFPQLKPTVAITGIQISGGVTRVYANGADEDGQVINYVFSVDGVVADTLMTPVLSASIAYSGMDDEHEASVVAVDNEGLVSDAAKIVFTPNSVGAANKTPDTQIISPPAGATTSEAVVVQWDARDPDGSLTGYQIKFDNDAWTDVAVGTNSYTKTGLAVGSHAVQVRAKDNFDLWDPTPAAIAFTVMAGLTPELTTSGVTDGATFFVSPGGSVDLTVEWDADAAYYYGEMDHYTYSLDGATATSTNDASYTFAGVAAGNHTIDITAVDLSGNTSAITINVVVAVLAPTKEVLFVNGIDWGSYPETGGVYAVTLGTAGTWDYWELLGAPSGGYPAGMNINPVGSGAITGADIADYKAVLWSGNNYLGDLELWNPSLIASYIKAGGKVLLHARRTVTFFNSELSSMAHVTAWVPDLTGSFSAMNPTTDGTALGLQTINFGSNTSVGGAVSIADGSYVEALYMSGDIISGLRSQATEDGTWNFAVLAGRQYRVTNPAALRDAWYTVLESFGITPPAK